MWNPYVRRQANMTQFLGDLKSRLADAEKTFESAQQKLQEAQTQFKAAQDAVNVWRLAVELEAPKQPKESRTDAAQNQSEPEPHINEAGRVFVSTYNHLSGLQGLLHSALHCAASHDGNKT